jgi:hypothetical protein
MTVGARAGTVTTEYGKSYQVNVNSLGQNIPGDAANEPSICIDPTNPLHIAVGWRQFDTTNSNFRQSGYAYTTNGGLNWTFPGKIDPGVFRSDPVLQSDANGVFYYLGISNDTTFAEDLYRSTNGGQTWQLAGPALGGDKEWMMIDKTAGPGRGNIYQVWSPFYNVPGNGSSSPYIFTRSIDSGATWMAPIVLPHSPYFGTLDVGPDGELYLFANASDLNSFVVNRSTNAQNRLVTPTIDQTAIVDLGGPQAFGISDLNPGGLLGQAWIVTDHSSGSLHGNVYLLCSVVNDTNSVCNVMFSRSTDKGLTWSDPVRVNDDPTNTDSAHWFGTLSVAPNGRLDACWNDTRNSTNHTISELFYSWSYDGGITWAPNRRISPQFDPEIGWPQQEKIGDYMGMVSLDEGACIAYAATFNGEEDVYFARPELPINVAASRTTNSVKITWNSTLGISYQVQAITNVTEDWSAASTITNLVASGGVTTVFDTLSGGSQRFYRVVRTP